MKKAFLIFLSVILLIFCSCNINDPIPKENPETENMEKALDSAKFHLATTAYSYKGLVALLEYNGYTYEEAVYAAENCGADWFEEASLCAKDLLAFSSFTKEALVFQLQIKGFTLEEATYGAEQNGY